MSNVKKACCLSTSASFVRRTSTHGGEEVGDDDMLI